MWYVYILLCADNSLYTGATNNLTKRFHDHATGKGSAYTRSHKPVKLIYQEQCSSKSAALKREAAIKRLPRSQKIASLQLTW